VAWVGQTRKIEQDEAELERAPGMVSGRIERVQRGRLFRAARRLRTAHAPAGVPSLGSQSETRQRPAGCIKQRNADADAVERLATAGQRRPGRAQI